MSGIMNFLTMIAMLYLFGSCNQPSSSSETQHSNKEEMKQEIQIEADSIVVNYWKNTEANEYHFSYTKEKIEIRSAYFNFEKTVRDELIIQQFLNYIHQFYLEKSERIIQKRIKRNYLESADYPYLQTVGYLKGKEVFKNRTQIGEEEYDVGYNPKFLEFYDFLDSLIREE